MSFNKKDSLLGGYNGHCRAITVGMLYHMIYAMHGKYSRGWRMMNN